MNSTNIARAILAALFASASLVGCGGGGGTGDGASASPAPTPSPSPAPDNLLQTTLAPSNYPAGSIAAAVYARINAERQQCGFGLIAQNLHLDQSAQAHAGYLKNQMDSQGAEPYFSSGASLHNEITGQPGFTGVTPSDRMGVAGYESSAIAYDTSEGVAANYTQASDSSAQRGERLTRYLLTSTYHLGTLISHYREVGIGVVNSTNTAYAPAYSLDSLVLDYGYASAPQLATSVAGVTVATYPCNGSTGAWPAFSSGERPDPAPSLGLSYPLGTPIYIEGAGALAGLSVTLTPAAGQAVSTAILTSANDQNHYVQSNQAYVLPSKPLVANTIYSVTISGTTGGTPFVRSFTFTTGANPA